VRVGRLPRGLRVSAPQVEMPEYWTIEDVARYFKVSRRTAERMGIPYAKIGRRRVYLPKDVAEFLLEKVS
jgi:hypothetical protein